MKMHSAMLTSARWQKLMMLGAARHKMAGHMIVAVGTATHRGNMCATCAPAQHPMAGESTRPTGNGAGMGGVAAMLGTVDRASAGGGERGVAVGEKPMAKAMGSVTSSVILSAVAPWKRRRLLLGGRRFC